MSDLIAYHLEDGIATLTLSNGKVNAISPDVISAFNARWTRPSRIARWSLLPGNRAFSLVAMT